MNFTQIANNIPNLITLARMVMTPVAVQMIVSDRYLAAFLIFLLAGVSDGVDGFIARRFGLRTELGAYLDPLADKALLISIYVSLAIYGDLPAWVAIAVVSRDVMIVVAVIVSWLLDKPVEIRPVGNRSSTPPPRSRSPASRSARAPTASTPSRRQSVLEWMVAATVVASGGVYVAQWLDHMTR